MQLQQLCNIAHSLLWAYIGIQNVWNDVKKVNLIWHYVVFDKEMISTRTKEQLDKLREDTIEIISRIGVLDKEPP